jgi:hypothetical protein
VPNVCVDRPTRGRALWPNETAGDWATSDAARRVLAASTGVLSERGFTGWGGARAGTGELKAELRWMGEIEAAGKAYYSINEVKVGLSHIVALHHRSSIVCHIYKRMVGSSFSEATMRLNPR